MSQFLFGSGNCPIYHEGRLIVKMRPSVSTFAAVGRATAEGLLDSPGLSVLAAFERAGMIKRVVPLSQPAPEYRPPMGIRGAVAVLANLPAQPVDTTTSNGINIIEMERDQDVEDLQIALARDPNVESVSRIPVRYLVAQPRSGRRSSESRATIAATPPAASTMWNLRKILWSDARALPNFQDADNISVAVLDTGIDENHPDLQDRVASNEFEHPDLPTASANQDIVGHGTHVSGTIAATINNNLGINGICNCQLRSWKIFDDTTEYIAARNEFAYIVEPVMYRRALLDCLRARVNVINLSIGGGAPPDFFEQLLFNALLANGTTIVAAMGNERQFGSPTSFPAAIPGVIAVGATRVDDKVANFSNRGNHISLCAPGVAIWSTLPTAPGQVGFDVVAGPGGRPIEGRPQRRETDYDAWDGTSMATPHVAAAVALLLANKGTMNPTEVRDQLTQSVDPVPGMLGQPFHPDYGAGRLNLLRLLSNSNVG